MYVILGYLVSTEQWNRTKRWTLYVFALLSGVFAVWYTVNKSAQIGETTQFLFSYNYFPSALTGAAIFVFVKYLFDGPLRNSILQKGGAVTKFIRTISNCCMGVWLTHSLGITLIAVFTDLTSSDYIWRFACPFAVFGACVLGTYIVKKIPVLKYIV